MSDATDALWDAAHSAPSKEAGNRIVQLVHRNDELEQEITALELRAQELAAEKLRLLTIELPEAMTQAGTSKFTTENGGLTVEVKNHVSGSLMVGKDDEGAATRAAQIAYIAEQGGDGIIKADLVASFGKTNRAAAEALAATLKDRDDCTVVVKEDVNHMTLKKWGRERLEADPAFEPKRAGLWAGKIAVIKTA
jgi:hypothetical protein